MVKGDAQQTKVHYKGTADDFIVFVDDAAAAKQFKTDKTIPLAQVVSSFKVFVTHKHGAQGQYDGASNATLDNEFGTHKEEEVIKMILEKGDFQETTMGERQGVKNESMGAKAGH